MGLDPRPLRRASRVAAAARGADRTRVARGRLPPLESRRPRRSLSPSCRRRSSSCPGGWAGSGLLGALVGLGLAARDVWQVVRLKRRTVPLTVEELARLARGLSAWTSSRAPRLAWCAELDAPAVLGFVRPVIALPRAQVSSLLDSQPRFVVLHELAHVRRGDDWWALAGRIILAVTWVNPAVHWVLREMSVSREMACDEWVVKQTAAPVAYATCLADVAALRTRARRLRLATGVTGRPGTLRRRVVGVLALRSRPPARAAAVVAWLAPVAVCAAAAGLLRLPPVFVVGNPPDAAFRVPAQAGPADPVERVSDGASRWHRQSPAPQVKGRRAPSARRASEARADSGRAGGGARTRAFRAGGGGYRGGAGRFRRPGTACVESSGVDR